MIQLPLFPSISANFSYEIVIENQVITIQFIYNIANGYFSAYITDGAGNQVNSIKVVKNWPLLKYRKAYTDIKGDFFLQPLSVDTPEEILYDDLETKWGLFYYTPAELEEWETTNGVQ